MLVTLRIAIGLAVGALAGLGLNRLVSAGSSAHGST
jgi:hypothetical protein